MGKSSVCYVRCYIMDQYFHPAQYYEMSLIIHTLIFKTRHLKSSRSLPGRSLHLASQCHAQRQTRLPSRPWFNRQVYFSLRVNKQNRKSLRNVGAYRWNDGTKDKWLPFRRRQFQIQFLEWKCMNIDWNFTEVCSYNSNHHIPASVHIMAWCRPGDKPLS